jgi:methyl-accepting chemotaxis protein
MNTPAKRSSEELNIELEELHKKQVDLAGQVAAINRSHAVIEFDLQGNILAANENFLLTMGYSMDEVVGHHHSMFADPGYAKSAEYKDFWARLRAGDFFSDQFKRVGKGGREVWIEASYNPIFDEDGHPFKVVKYATDVSDKKLEEANVKGQLEAINKTQAVIEFDPTGIIKFANDNFLSATGYHLDEIVGQHHRMFVDPAYAQSREYQSFWERLAHGEFATGEYRRFAKGHTEIWLQASYNPIYDMNGEVYKVVKYASDITQEKLANANFEGQIQAISKLQAVIEFELDGTIITANDNFLQTLGYSLSEIQGKHHRMFVQPEYAASRDYSMFWDKLNRGEYDASEYLRLGKGGKEVWIQASYNPIFDMNGKPYKVVKYATDITGQKSAQKAISRLIDAASRGDLDQRIDASAYDGFVRELSDGVNQLVTAIVTPVNEAVRVVKSLSEGDLAQTMEGEFEGAFAVLQEAVNATVTNLEKMVGDILAAAQLISTGAREISEGNINLSQRTEEQASSLEQTAASMEELTSTVQQSADNASHASSLALAARTSAEQGGNVVSEAVQAMQNINTASNKIADIIGVINEIAFQTNLLALNAAVEAARAGEHGRGFAVVASEVRSLAQRTADSAKEIRTLIKDSVERVSEGSELVNTSGESLKEIVTAVSKVTDIVDEMAAAGREQAQGIQQVNQAVTQMDEVTQQNAALVEESAASSESLDEQAAGLEQLMQFFKLPGRALEAGDMRRARTQQPAESDRRRPHSPGNQMRPERNATTRRPSAAPSSGNERDAWESF